MSIILLEGIRKSGKSHTLSVLEKNGYNVYKDLGISHYKPAEVDVDDFAIGRDYAYAQIIHHYYHNSLIFDRGYLSSCVYGQFYRQKYDKQFWFKHQDTIEKLYRSHPIVIVFIEVKDFNKLAAIERNKDNLETSDVESYVKQYELYTEILNNSSLIVKRMQGFREDEYILDYFDHVLKYK